MSADAYTLHDLAGRIPNFSGTTDQGRGDCPICGGKNTLSIRENGRLLLHCHKCGASFNDLLDALMGRSCIPVSVSAKKPATPPPNPEKIYRQGHGAPPDHPYLKKKGIGPVPGLKQADDGRLMVPVMNFENVLHGLQFIDDQGEKRFLTDTKKKGHFFQIGEPGETIYICEGFATGASIHQTTTEAVFVAFDCGNLRPVAEAIRQRWPDIEIVIAADNDQFKEKNPGLIHGREAALAVNARLAVPEFRDLTGEPTDFNDLANREGVYAVLEQLEAAEMVDPGTLGTLGTLDFEENEDHQGTLGTLGTLDFREIQKPPLDVFPSEIQEFINNAVETFGTTQEIVIGGLLAIAGGVIGCRRVIRIKKQWMPHAALYLLVCASTGESKSPVINWLMEPVEALERRLLEEWREDMAIYEQRLSIHKKGDDIPKPPIRHQVKVGDSTMEALVNALGNNPGGLLEYRDEARGIFTDQDKYSNARGSDQVKRLEIYDRRPVQVDRLKKDRVSYVYAPSLGVLGSIQPATLRDSFNTLDAAAGYLGRFIVLHSQNGKPSLWSEKEMSSRDVALWGKLINHFHYYDMIMDDRGWMKPRIIDVTQEAKELYIGYYNELSMLPFMQENVFMEILPKAKEHCLRLCLILHCIHCVVNDIDELSPVSLDTMRGAIALSRWIYQHQVRTWRMVVKRLSEPDKQPIEKRISKAIISLKDKIKNGVLSTRDITEQVNLDVPEQYWVTSKTIGRICSNRLGLATKKSGGIKFITLSHETMQRLKNT